MSGLRVLRPGPLSSLQDGGRRGWQHLGVSPAGPVDGHAAAWANRLLGNPWGTPLLEIALGGLLLEAEGDTWIAVCGADVPIQVDGAPRPAWSRFALGAGQRLELGFARSGLRAYLAVAGGFVAPPALGSVATQCRERLGGLDGIGSALREGDRLGCGPARLAGAGRVPWRFIPDYGHAPLLRVVLGGDARAFDAPELARFFSQAWQVTAQSDRMGTRLAGEPLKAPLRTWSEGVALGTVQVPPDGQPIVLLADRQTMGGYPVLGWVPPRDCWRLAQCAAHRAVRFAPVKLEVVEAELKAFYRFFS